MQNEFIPYEQALELKELGFDEPCFGYYNTTWSKQNELLFPQYAGELENWNEMTHLCSAPTYSQAFEFFEEKFKLFPTLHVDQTMEPKFGYSIAEFFEDEGGFFDWKNIMSSYLYYTRQESKLECLRELIKIAKNRKQ
jgi:hypothetical protein